MKNIPKILVLGALALALPGAAMADEIRTVRVQFERGTSGATITDQITGYESVNYVLGAREGQFLRVSLRPDNRSAGYNIYVPGKGPGDEALYHSDTGGGYEYYGQLYLTGDHAVSVFLNRNAARDGQTANYDIVFEITSDSASEAVVPAAPVDGGPRNWEVSGVSQALNLREEPSTHARTLARLAPGTVLDNLGCQRADSRVWCDVQELGGGPRGYVAAEFLKPAVAPDGSVAAGPDDSALRAGQGDFDATGRIPCAQQADQPMVQCEFGVARAGGGNATVVVTRPDGESRGLYFRMGRAVGADTSEADNTGAFRAEKESDLHLIRVGDERYEIPDAVVLGG